MGVFHFQAMSCLLFDQGNLVPGTHKGFNENIHRFAEGDLSATLEFLYDVRVFLRKDGDKLHGGNEKVEHGAKEL